MMGGAAGLEAEPSSGWRKSRKLKWKDVFFYSFFLIFVIFRLRDRF